MRRERKRAARVSGIHERIRIDAEELRALAGAGFTDVAQRPALAGLLEAAMASIEASLPAFVDYEGHRYWLCVRVLAEIGVHDSPGAARPLARVVSTGRWSGHRPGH